jgi:oligopeptide/dipeptide ABC transporter ATP-binding protein
MPLAEIQDLSIDFVIDGQSLPAVSGVSFQVERGEILALVGESGCGKSATCLALARLLPEPPARYSSGDIVFHDDQGGTQEVLRLGRRELRRFRRRRLAYIFQEPSVSLNPVLRVGDQIGEAVALRHDGGDPDAETLSLLAQVGIPDPARRRCYPHELSGGMQQRVMIAMALASHPQLLVADEPTTALDVTIQAQILDLIRRLRSETGMTVILVTHNLGIVADMADRVIVMYAGHTVEQAPTAALLAEPLHPYTRALLAAVPELGHAGKRLNTIPGTVPSPAHYPPGCRFVDRCPLAATLADDDRKRCRTTVPDWRELRTGHHCRCHFST